MVSRAPWLGFVDQLFAEIPCERVPERHPGTAMVHDGRVVEVCRVGHQRAVVGSTPVREVIGAVEAVRVERAEVHLATVVGPDLELALVVAVRDQVARV